MTFKDYQKLAMTTALPSSMNPTYMVTEICGEAGEIAGKFAKYVRDGVWDHELTKKEIGDVLWGCAGLCATMGWDLEDIAVANIAKLQDRKQRGVLQGNGDTR